MDQQAQFIASSSYSRPVDRKKLRFMYDQLVAHARRTDRALGDLTVLDLGCSAGALTIPIAGVAGHVDADDVDVEALDQLRERLSQRAIRNVGIFEGDATSFGGAGTYDVVVASEMIENVPDPQALLANVARLLRPDGVLLATVPNGYGPFELRNRHLNPRARLARSNRLRRRFGKEPYVAGAGRDAAHFLRYSELLAMLERAGFARLAHQNSDWMTPMLFASRRERAGTTDCDIADRLPPALVSGWYLAAAKVTVPRAR